MGELKLHMDLFFFWDPKLGIFSPNPQTQDRYFQLHLQVGQIQEISICLVPVESCRKNHHWKTSSFFLLFSAFPMEDSLIFRRRGAFARFSFLLGKWEIRWRVQLKYSQRTTCQWRECIEYLKLFQALDKIGFEYTCKFVSPENSRFPHQLLWFHFCFPLLAKCSLVLGHNEWWQTFLGKPMTEGSVSKISESNHAKSLRTGVPSKISINSCVEFQK